MARLKDVRHEGEAPSVNPSFKNYGQRGREKEGSFKNFVYLEVKFFFLCHFLGTKWIS